MQRGCIEWPCELEEVKRQLKDLLDLRFIQPYKALYDALMLL